MEEELLNRIKFHLERAVQEKDRKRKILLEEALIRLKEVYQLDLEAEKRREAEKIRIYEEKKRIRAEKRLKAVDQKKTLLLVPPLVQ